MSSDVTASAPEAGVDVTARSRSLRFYLGTLVAVVALVAAAGAFYQRSAAEDNARHSALQSARSGALSAANDLASGVQQVQTQVASLAANPQIDQVLKTPKGCTLTFGGSGPSASGHLDIVDAFGRVRCTSLANPTGVTYASSSWFHEALTTGGVFGPALDARTGQPVEIVTSPLAGRGAVVAFLNWRSIGPDLAKVYGGPFHLAFVVTSASGATILASSTSPRRWSSASAAGTAFAGARFGGEHPDLAGIPRLYGSSTVAGLGWHVYAGESAALAVTSADQRSDRLIAISLAGFLIVLVLGVVIYRRVARPIAAMSATTRNSVATGTFAPVSVAGPLEVATLAQDLNSLLAGAARERDTGSRLAAIIGSSPDAIIGMDRMGVIDSWNPGAEALYGYAESEMVGRSIAAIVPTARTTELDALGVVARGEAVTSLDTQCVHRDGHLVDVSISIAPIRDVDGRVTGLTSVARDISERLHSEAERRALEGRVNQSERLESLGQLAGGVAHDFNNLLSVILNYASFVAEEAGEDSTVQDDVEQIRFAAERAAALTRQLLIFARRETTEPEALDLNAVIAGVQELLSRSLGEHIHIVVTPDPDLPSVVADQSQIEQVLLNLAVNARDAMPAGGVLTVETRRASVDLEYSGRNPDLVPGDYVELSVSDTGVGMSAELQARIFDPFFTTKSVGRGTGLGLATVYGVATKFGGGVHVYSEVGVGSTFRVYFPAADLVPVASSDERVAAGPEGRGEVILVVEDEPGVLELTARILQGAGYGVLAAGGADEAVRLAAEAPFDLLLTDSVMPQMSGQTLADEIQRVHPGHGLLFMSGYSDHVVTPAGVLDEGTALLQKPFNRLTLLTKVRAALDARADPR